MAFSKEEQKEYEAGLEEGYSPATMIANIERRRGTSRAKTAQFKEQPTKEEKSKVYPKKESYVREKKAAPAPKKASFMDNLAKVGKGLMDIGAYGGSLNWGTEVNTPINHLTQKQSRSSSSEREPRTTVREKVVRGKKGKKVIIRTITKTVVKESARRQNRDPMGDFEMPEFPF